MPRLTTNELGRRLMPIGTVDNRHSACGYSMAGLPAGAAMNS